MFVDWSDSALRDLEDISDFIEQDRGIDAANRVAQKIYDSIGTLPLMPRRGRQGRLEGTRELIISGLPYLVLYRVGDDRILIIGILHGAQRWPEGDV